MKTRFGDILRRVIRCEKGAAGIEYALLAVGISIAILSTIFAIGSEMRNYFELVDEAIDPCAGSGSASDTGRDRGRGSGCGQR